MKGSIKATPTQLDIPGLHMAQPSASSPSALPPTLDRLRTLLIDDSPFVRDVTVETLTALGVRHIQCAADGWNALLHLTRDPVPPDVILCDLAMPSMDGLEFIRHLGTRAYGGAIILISGHSERLLGSACELVRSLDLRLAGAIRKPLVPKVLEALLAASATPTAAARPGAPPPALTLSADELRNGLARGHAQILLQPQVAVRTGDTVGFEALLRWHDPERGILPPPAVVASAEAAGLVDDLTYAVFRAAAGALQALQERGYPGTVSVNLSVENLAQLQLPETLQQIAAEQGVVPEHLVLEVTESRLIHNLAASLEVLGRLSLGGFRLSMDDYGTGYSTLEMLKKLPFDELKIDRTFVTGAVHDLVTRTILRSSIELGRALGMTVVAEGIETERELDLLTMLGADIGQGYWFAKPQPLSDALRRVSPARSAPLSVA